MNLNPGVTSQARETLKDLLCMFPPMEWRDTETRLLQALVK